MIFVSLLADPTASIFAAVADWFARLAESFAAEVPEFDLVLSPALADRARELPMTPFNNRAATINAAPTPAASLRFVHLQAFKVSRTSAGAEAKANPAAGAASAAAVIEFPNPTGAAWTAREPKTVASALAVIVNPCRPKKPRSFSNDRSTRFRAASSLMPSLVPTRCNGSS
jgi:hypothetical protein